MTRTVLTLASVVVAIFVSLNLYTYASQSRRTNAAPASLAQGDVASVTIPVEGMACFTCELAVESSLRGLPGVHSADAKVKEAAAHVQYDPARVKPEDLVAAINKTGYTARRPKDQ